MHCHDAPCTIIADVGLLQAEARIFAANYLGSRLFAFCFAARQKFEFHLFLMHNLLASDIVKSQPGNEGVQRLVQTSLASTSAYAILQADAYEGINEPLCCLPSFVWPLLSSTELQDCPCSEPDIDLRCSLCLQYGGMHP